jgi:hypothetical protein
MLTVCRSSSRTITAIRPTSSIVPAAVVTAGNVKELEIDFDLSKIPTGTVSYHADLDNDGTLDGWSDEDAYLPANASIVAGST